MCVLNILFEFKPGQLPCWMAYDCGTAIRLQTPLVPSSTISAAGTIKGKLFNSFPCPIHQPDEFRALNLPPDGSISRIGQLADISKDQA